MNPPKRSSVGWRNLGWSAHRWIALALMVLLAPISLSGSLLVWHEALDGLVNPGRYAISGREIALSSSEYVARAQAALPSAFSATTLQFPADGGPVTVIARAAPPVEGARPPVRRVYLDPPSGRVLDVIDISTSLIGVLHRFHENLTIPDFFGRQIVGWLGVAMLTLSLTGVWLWWPRNGAFLSGLRWRRAPKKTANLHFLIGFWIAIPLAIVSLTGIYLAFQHTARSLTSAVASMSPQRQGYSYTVEPARDTRLDIDAALVKALDSVPGARASMIALPPAGGRRDWRIQLLHPAQGRVTVLVDDATGAQSRAPDPLAGDRAAQWIRWIHEGSHLGTLWSIFVFACGIAPPTLALTGLVMWYRGRRKRRSILAAADVAPSAVI